EGFIAKRRHRIPDLEADAVRYLHDDYVVDASKLAATGFVLRYPDFASSLAQLRTRP
ncbi:MAG: hypothetical protein H6Q90_3965, partial [Deltaproteobacteria bacterium]|nr:hypothetical protein [Deltaproteobacteria bacterium]